MTRLAARDLEGILELSFEAREFDDLEAYRKGILPRLRRLVPAIQAGYNEVEPDTGETLFRGDPPDAFFDGVEDVFAAVAHEHPLVARVAAGERDTHTISEFLSEDEFHQLDLYRKLFHRLGAEDQIAFALPGEVLIGIALNRSSRSFTERDHAVLEAVRPHLTQAYLEVRNRMLARSIMQALEAGLEDVGGAIILLDSQSQIAYIGEPARKLRDTYFGASATGGLPAVLSTWLERPGPAEALTVSAADGHLTVRRITAGYPDDGCLLELRERRSGPPSAESLERSLGLTRRQSQVLQLVCTGINNEDVAAALTIQPATVRKYLEQIYERLGVRSRAAAVARVLETPRD